VNCPAPATPGPEPAAREAVAILAALRRELAPLEASLMVSQRFRAGSFQASVGWLNGTQVIVACTGDGRENAARGAQALLERYQVGSLMVIGIAGGLSPSLPVGRLLVAREVIEDGRLAPAPDTSWLERARRSAGATPAIFVSTRDMLCTPQAKADAYSELTGGPVAAVDLETATFARAASKRGLPYLALRAISDTAEESLPLDFNTLRDRTGAVNSRLVALRALARPRLLPSLLDWRRRVSCCSENLARAVQTLLAGGCP
jgi:adenosylhomocysteine nucleosidase